MRAVWAAVISSIAGLFMSVKSSTGDSVAFGVCVFIVLLVVFYGLWNAMDDMDLWD